MAITPAAAPTPIPAAAPAVIGDAPGSLGSEVGVDLSGSDVEVEVDRDELSVFVGVLRLGTVSTLQADYQPVYSPESYTPRPAQTGGDPSSEISPQT